MVGLWKLESTHTDRIHWLRRSFSATKEEIANTKDVAGFYYAMVKRFPDANLFISNEMNAGVFKGGMDWNWKEEED